MPIALACKMVLGQTTDPTILPTDSTTKVDNVFNLSLEDLMNTPIVSASKEKESSFDAPLTSCVITRAEINNMGATSIPDALRFCPAIIVREVANGSYDVSIRGGVDGLPSYQYSNVNTTILAMIDNRPVFSAFQGGTFWQNLPVDLADVERIEVVYGPNAPMYGPNAVSGVINIITKKEASEKKTMAHANLQRGVSNIYSAYIGHKISDQLEISASANSSNRVRGIEEYYNPKTDSYSSDVQHVTSTTLPADVVYTIRDFGSKRTGANFNINYTPAKRVFLNVNSTYNNNQAWTQLMTSNSLNVQTNTSNSHMVRAEVYNFTFQSSLLKGNQGLLGNEKSYSHDYATFDNYLDYNIRIKEKLSIRPAISYQYASVNDEKYTVNVGKTGIFNSNAAVETMSGSLKLDYKAFNWLRLIAAGRMDKLSKPDKVYPSYQFAANVKPSENHIFRASTGRSFNGGFIVPSFVGFTGFDGQLASQTFVPGFPTEMYYRLDVKGNPNRELLQNDNVELGYKGQLGKNVQVDVNLFYQEFKNFNTYVNQKSTQEVLALHPGLPFALPSKIKITQQSLYQTLDTKVYQKGVSFSVLFVTNNKVLSVKPHLTLQESRVADYQQYYYQVGANDQNPGLDLGLKTNVYSKGTPSWLGGFTINLNPISRLNLGLSGYYYDQTTMTTIAGQPAESGGIVSGTINDRIQEKGIFNAHVTYKVHDNISLGFNARNLTDNTSREAWGSDRLGAQYYGTLIVEY